METVLLTIALIYLVWSTAILVFDADIWLKDKLKGYKSKEEEEETPPPPVVDLIVRHTYGPKVRALTETPPNGQGQTTNKEEGEALKESEVTFEENVLPKKSIRIPDNKLDEAFTDTRIEDVGVEYDDSEEVPDMEQASGNSFEEIGKAVDTVHKSDATNDECAHAGKVFSEMEGNELFRMIAERSKHIKRRIDALMELHMSSIPFDKPMSEKVASVKKKKFVVPDDIKNFNIRDYV